MRHEEGNPFLRDDIFSRCFGQIHAGLEDVFIERFGIHHAVNCQQRGFKCARAKAPGDDIHILRRTQPAFENVDIAHKIRHERYGVVFHGRTSFLWNTPMVSLPFLFGIMHIELANVYGF